MQMDNKPPSRPTRRLPARISPLTSVLLVYAACISGHHPSPRREAATSARAPAGRALTARIRTIPPHLALLRRTGLKKPLSLSLSLSLYLSISLFPPRIFDPEPKDR